MDSRRRFVTAVVLTAIAFAAMTVLLVARLQHWNRIGWTGLNFIPETRSGSKVKVTTSAGGPSVRRGITSPGTVIVSYQGAPAAKAGIEAGDTIERINGVALNELERLNEMDGRLVSGDAVTYRVRRGNAVRDVTVALTSPLNTPQMVLHFAISLILAVSFAAIGFVVFFRKADDRRAGVFYAMAMAGALSFLGTTMIALDGSNLRGIVSSPQRGLTVMMAYLFATFAFAALTLHLSLVFPHDRPIIKTRPYAIRWIYAVPTFALVVLSTSISLALRADSLKARITSLRPVSWYLIPVLAVTAAVLLIHILRARGGQSGIAVAYLSRPVQTILAFFALLCSAALLIAALGSPGIAIILVLLVGVLPIFGLFAYPAMTFVSLYRSYRDSGVEEKRQVKWPLW